MFCTVFSSFGVYSSAERRSKSATMPIGACLCQSSKLFVLVGWTSTGRGQPIGWRCCCKWRIYFVAGGSVWDFTHSVAYEDGKKLGVVGRGTVHAIPKLILSGKPHGTMKTTSTRPCRVSSSGTTQELPMLANVSRWLAKLEVATCHPNVTNRSIYW